MDQSVFREDSMAPPRRIDGRSVHRLAIRWRLLLIATGFVLLPIASASAAEMRSVSERAAVLYDAPSTRAKKLYVVAQYYPVEVVVNVENWVKVRDVSGELAWVEKKLLSERRTLIVSVAMADVRQAAEEKSPLAFQAREGVVLELVEAPVAGWVKVRHRDGQLGYVSARQVWGL